MDSGGRKLHLDSTSFASNQRTRTSSISSIASNTSAISVFSNATEKDFQSCTRTWEEFLKEKKEEEELLKKIEEEVTSMISTLKTQANVNSTIKQGLPRVLELLTNIRSLESSSLKTAEEHNQMLEWTIEAAKVRSRIKDKMKAKVIRDMIVTSARGEKRDISPLPSPEKKKKKSNAEDTTIVATGAKKSTPLEVPPKKKTERKKKKKKSVKRPVKTEVTKNIVVKLEQGQTYASVLGKIRKESNPQTCNATVLGAMPTKRGDVLIRLDKKSDEKAFSTELRTICKGLGTVRESGKRPATIEVRDLDSPTEKSEVEEVLNEKLGEKNERKVHLLEPNKRNLKLAIILTTEEEATKLDQIGHICVGFVSCRIRRRVQVLRCYRCLGYGHRSHDCKAEDRSNACYKCGEMGHKRKDCTQKVQCFLCENEKEHTAGSATCVVFREALRKKRIESAKKECG